jgi:hypothetical protein
VWIKNKIPYMWDDQPRVGPDVGLCATNGTSCSCGEIWEDSSTSYPQEKLLSHLIHILETSKTAAHIWGYGFSHIVPVLGTSPQWKPLIHKLSRVIHICEP